MPGRAWRAWSAPGPARAAHLLAVGGCATLSLSAAATVNVVYTIRVPYALFAAASVVGFPLVVRGWRSVPAWVRWTALSLAAVYLVATATGVRETLGTGRGGGHRDLVYMADLILGLGIVGLVAGLWRSEIAREPAIRAMALGAVVAALYATYQWPARHFDLPLADINNTLDSNGVTSGAYQGAGLLGWERARGTFQEPHYLAAFLIGVLPIAALGGWMTGRRVLAVAAAAVVGIGLVLTVSVPAWAALAVGAAVSAALFAVARGRVAGSAALAAIAVALAVGAPAIAASPQGLAHVTGRSDLTLIVSANFRAQAWRESEQIWAGRPVLGLGPGQSSVQVALRERAAERRKRPTLASAQGLWAASLIDAGVLGFGAWLMFLGAVFLVGARALLRTPSVPLLAILSGAAAIVLGNEVGGDRLETAAWVLLGLLLAVAAGGGGGRDPGKAGE